MPDMFLRPRRKDEAGGGTVANNRAGGWTGDENWAGVGLGPRIGLEWDWGWGLGLGLKIGLGAGLGLRIVLEVGLGQRIGLGWDQG